MPCRPSARLAHWTTVSVPSSPDHAALSPALADAPILAHTVRSGVVESVHHGTAVVTSGDGAGAHGTCWLTGEVSR